MRTSIRPSTWDGTASAPESGSDRRSCEIGQREVNASSSPDRLSKNRLSTSLPVSGNVLTLARKTAVRVHKESFRLSCARAFSTASRMVSVILIPLRRANSLLMHRSCGSNVQYHSWMQPKIVNPEAIAYRRKEHNRYIRGTCRVRQSVNPNAARTTTTGLILSESPQS